MWGEARRPRAHTQDAALHLCVHTRRRMHVSTHVCEGWMPARTTHKSAHTLMVAMSVMQGATNALVCTFSHMETQTQEHTHTLSVMAAELTA